MSSENAPAVAEALNTSLEALSQRFIELGNMDLPGLTEPDAETGERWDAGQVWAHVTELVPYWTAEARRVVTAKAPAPVPFGRLQDDPGRTGAVEARRHVPAREQAMRLTAAIGELRSFLAGLPPEAWGARGQHPRIGVMDLHRIVNGLLVGHLESHAKQLEQLRARAKPPNR